MRDVLERLWVFWLNSDRWRRFSTRGLAGAFFRSRTFHRMDRARRYALTLYRSRREPALFDDVHAFCTFVGHVKSGSTLVGSLLDAHPDAIIADEMDVLGYVGSGFSREQIWHLLLKASRRDHLKGRVTARRLTPYSVAVPGQWQGRYRRLRVIGHSQAGPVTGKLTLNPQLLDALRARLDSVELKVIHVIRNPFDPISLMMIRGERSFANAIERYFSYCNTLCALHGQLDRATLLPIRYEAFVIQPQTHLRQICDFLGLEATRDYLEDCSDILYGAPEQSREIIDWDEHWISVVEEKIEEVPFLEGYRFDDLAAARHGSQTRSPEANVE